LIAITHSYQVLACEKFGCALKKQNRDWLFLTSWSEATLQMTI
jgi:hypothetical protein